MSKACSALDALEQVETLLVDPHPDNMLLAEKKLKLVVEEIQSANVCINDWQFLQRHAASCSFLLQQALQFWSVRQATAAPVVQYAAGGQLLSGGARSTFAVEL